MDDPYLIWSNEHEGWWRAGEAGYSPALKKAGHYTRERAIEICKRALPTAMHLGRISEIPVRFHDMMAIIDGQMVPENVIEERNRFADK